MRSVMAKEAASITGLHLETVRAYLRNGRIPADKVGRIYLIDPKVLEPLVESRPRRGRPSRSH